MLLLLSKKREKMLQEDGWRAAFLAAARVGDAIAGLGLRRGGRMDEKRNCGGAGRRGCEAGERWSGDRPGEIRALRGNGREGPGTGIVDQAGSAMMASVTAAAFGEVARSVRDKERSSQRPAEQEHHRDGQQSPHVFSENTRRLANAPRCQPRCSRPNFRGGL